MIDRITKTYTRVYSDTCQEKTYVEWVDRNGIPGRTEGDRFNGHMQALLKRAAREGIVHRHETF